jgi:hypothetical protein
MRFLPAIVVLHLLALAGCHAPQVNAPPGAAALPLDGPGYFVCGQCGSLDGGLYAQGPTKQLRTDAGQTCIHDWYPVSRNEFRELAVERFGIDWSQEAPRWPAGGDEAAASQARDNSARAN